MQLEVEYDRIVEIYAKLFIFFENKIKQISFLYRIKIVYFFFGFKNHIPIIKTIGPNWVGYGGMPMPRMTWNSTSLVMNLRKLKTASLQILFIFAQNGNILIWLGG